MPLNPTLSYVYCVDCAVCTVNYSKGPGFTCIKCSENGWGILATAVFVVIAMVMAFTAFTYLTSAEIMGTIRETIARLLGLVPLYSIKIIIVAWQIVTQVSDDTTSMGHMLCLHQILRVPVGDIRLRDDLEYFVAGNCKILPT